MKVVLAPGKYVVAVSGGVDSMALLHVLTELMAGDKGLELGDFTIAHFDHGIREDSAEDRKLVQQTAKQLGLPFVYKEGKLGPQASEAVAREKRYEFLREVQQQAGAEAIITAHHQDDALETAVMNLLRGTGRRGLSSLQSRSGLLRPFLHTPKASIIAYAQAHQVVWREDSTNQDPRYHRNEIRQRVMPRLDVFDRAMLWGHIAYAYKLNDEIDALLAELLRTQPQPDVLDRTFFIQLPHNISRELLAAWLRSHGTTFDRRSIERLVVFAKTAAPGKRADIDADHLLVANKKHITLRGRSGEQ